MPAEAIVFDCLLSEPSFWCKRQNRYLDKRLLATVLQRYGWAPPSDGDGTLVLSAENVLADIGGEGH
jgi:hypothetical protein